MKWRVAGAGLIALGVIAVAGTFGPSVRGSVEEPVAVTADRNDPPALEVLGGSHPLAYDWPLRPEPEVIRNFEPPAQSWAAGHRGIDLAAAASQPVHAAAAGVVTFAGWVVDRPVISIDHADGIRTTYEPVDPVVQVGTTVAAGTVIGNVTDWDAEPHCTQDCLHWGARTGPQTYIDPLTLLGLEPVVIRLYPY